MRDPDVAADLDQEFALRFLRGDLHRADPGRGRFRDFIKRALRNLVIDHHRQRIRGSPGLDAGSISEPVDLDAALPDFDRQFTESWHRELMARAWASLADHQQRSGQPHHTVLQYRARHPEQKSQEMAERLSGLLGKPVSAGWVRETLSQARERFAASLLDGVRASLDVPTRELVIEELNDLGLLDYCRPALQRRGLIR